ncbi:MAG: DsbA family oxidoreductase [Candidatus Puniceispirillales bacterium]
MNPHKTTIHVDIFSDIICPWCYIGWKRIATAAEMHQHVNLDISWRAFLLNPQMPEAGMDRQAYIQAKFGQAGGAFYDRVAEVGKHVGIDFNFSAITRTPDSKPAHYLIKAAGQHAHTINIKMMADYFEHGIDISAPDYHAAIMEEFDISSSQIDLAKTQVQADLEEASMMDIHGVPYIIIEHRWAVSGAHPPQAFLPLFDAAINAKYAST